MLCKRKSLLTLLAQKLILVSAFFLVMGITCKAVIAKDSTLVNTYKHRQPRQFVIKTNPFPLLWGVIPYTSEFRVIGEMTNGLKQSGQIGISFLGKSPFLSLIESSSRYGRQVSFDVTGIRIQGSYKFYLKPCTAPIGWYLSPHVSFATATIIERNNTTAFTYNATRLNGNLLLGKQYIRRNGFAFDWYFGIGKKDNTWREQSPGRTKPYYSLKDFKSFGNSTNIVLGCSFGYSF